MSDLPADGSGAVHDRGPLAKVATQELLAASRGRFGRHEGFLTELLE